MSNQQNNPPDYIEIQPDGTPVDTRTNAEILGMSSDQPAKCPTCGHAGKVNSLSGMCYAPKSEREKHKPCGHKCPFPASTDAPHSIDPKRSNHFTNEAIDRGTFPAHISADGRAFYKETVSVGPSARCVKCHHSPLPETPLDDVGRCVVRVTFPDGDVDECGCRCEFAPAEPSERHEFFSAIFDGPCGKLTAANTLCGQPREAPIHGRSPRYDRELSAQFHKVWTSQVGTEGYDKDQWQKLRTLLLQRGIEV